MNRTAQFIFATTLALAVVVPAFGGVASAAPVPAAPTTGAGTTPTDTTITVRVGDSLVGLSHRYQIRLSALLRANSLEMNSIIHPSDTLVIPAGATLPTSGGSTRTLTTSTGSSPTTSTVASTPATSSSDYVVEAGDALSGIAWRHGVSLGALVKANGISVTDLVLPASASRFLLRRDRSPPANPPPRPTPRRPESRSPANRHRQPRRSRQRRSRQRRAARCRRCSATPPLRSARLIGSSAQGPTRSTARGSSWQRSARSA